MFEKYANRLRKYNAVIIGNGFNYGLLNELRRNCRCDEYKYLFKFSEFANKFKNQSSKDLKDSYLELAIKLFNMKNILSVKELVDVVQQFMESEDFGENMELYEMNITLFCCSYSIDLCKDLFKDFGREKEHARWLSNSLIVACLMVKDNMIEYLEGISKEASLSISEENRAEFEYWTKKKYREIAKAKKAMDLLYNVWDVALNAYIKDNEYLEDVRVNYYKSFEKRYLKNDAVVITTNYNNEMEKYWKKVEYLHGKFAQYNEENQKFDFVKDEEECILFAATSCMKHHMVEKQKYSYSFFDKEDVIEYGNLFIYGLGFNRAAFPIVSWSENRFAHEDIIDGHILKAISDNMEKKKIAKVYINAYSEKDYKNYCEVLKCFKGVSSIKIYEYYMQKKIEIVKAYN